MTKVTWLILPVVICLSQRLSHACLSINKLPRIEIIIIIIISIFSIIVITGTMLGRRIGNSSQGSFSVVSHMKSFFNQATTSKDGSRRANYPILTQGGSDKK